MDFDGLVRKLGKVDCEPLRQKVLSLDESWWFVDDTRQKQFDVHAHTRSIIMLFCNGWPNVEIKKRRSWDLLVAETAPLVQHITQNIYRKGGAVLRAMVASMPPGAVIPPHYDKHPTFAIAHRVHIPLQTNEDVVFKIDDIRHKFDVGQAYEINNLKRHEVSNEGSEDRIHFIFDYMPPKKQRKASGRGAP